MCRRANERPTLRQPVGPTSCPTPTSCSGRASSGGTRGCEAKEAQRTEAALTPEQEVHPRRSATELAGTPKAAAIQDQSGCSITITSASRCNTSQVAGSSGWRHSRRCGDARWNRRDHRRYRRGGVGSRHHHRNLSPCPFRHGAPRRKPRPPGEEPPQAAFLALQILQAVRCKLYIIFPIGPPGNSQSASPRETSRRLKPRRLAFQPHARSTRCPRPPRAQPLVKARRGRSRRRAPSTPAPDLSPIPWRIETASRA